jgi:hypothetical protein
MARGAQTTGRPKFSGWHQWTEEEARAALAELAQSRQSVAEFAGCRGFSTARIRYWKKRLGVTAIPAFVPVGLPVATRATTVTRTIEILVGDVTVRVREDLDVEHVARIVEALADRARGC